MTRHLIFWVFVLQCVSVEGQQLKLGSNPSSINKSSVLELESSNQGLLLTRIPDTAVANLAIAPTGTLIFFNGDSSLRFRRGGYWQTVGVMIKATFTVGAGGIVVPASGTTLTQQVSVPNAALHAAVSVSPGSALPNSVAIAYAYVNAAGKVTIGFISSTLLGATIPAGTVFDIAVLQ